MLVKALFLTLVVFNMLPIADVSANFLAPPPKEFVIPQAASIPKQTITDKIENLSDLIYSFLSDTPFEERVEFGPIFYAWQYWITWKLGEKERGITNAEIDRKVREMITRLYEQHGEFEITSEMREDLNNLARHDIAVERMVAKIEEKEPVTFSSIRNYLAERYNDADISELEDLVRYFSAVKSPLQNLLGAGSDLFVLHGTDAGFITGMVLSLRKELIRDFGGGFIRREDIMTKIEEEFDELIALKPHVEDLLGKPINFFHPSGLDFGFLRAFAAQVEGGLENPPSGQIYTPMWKWRELPRRRTLDYVINERIPRIKFIKAVCERAYGRIFDLVGEKRDISLVMHRYDVGEERQWTEYDILQNLAPGFDKWLIGALRGLYQRFDWTNCFNANRPVPLNYQNMSVSGGTKSSIFVPEDKTNWRPYAYLQLEIDTRRSNASSVLSITIRNNIGEKAEYRVPLYNLPQGRKVEVKIPLRRYVVDSTGDKIPDVIAWDGFIKDPSWKKYVDTPLDTDISLPGLSDFNRIVSIEFSSSDGEVIFSLK